MNMSPETQEVMSVAVNDAAVRGHEFVGLEHLLFAMLAKKTVPDLISGCGCDVEALRDRLDGFLSNSLEIIPKERRRLPQPTLALQRVLAKANSRSGFSRTETSPIDIVVSMFSEQESWAVHFLDEIGLDRPKVLHWDHNGGNAPIPPPLVQPKDEEDDGPMVTDAIGKYTVDLRCLAAQKRLDPLVGRKTELDRVIHVLARRKKNNPVLLGDPGVGKTAIAEGLAQRVEAGMVPPFLLGMAVRSLDVGALVAGTRYRGDFEERMRVLLAEAKAMRGRIILFIDEMHMLLGAGAANGAAMDAANLLKPALASGDLRCIGATTHDEYRKHVEKDAALARRFQPVEVVEPPVVDSIQILGGLLDGYASHHGVSYAKDALARAVVLSDRHIRDRKLPGKAVDVMDEAGAAASLAGRRTVTVEDIDATVSAMARVPIGTLSGTDKARSLPDELKRVIFGQDEAIDRVSAAVQASLAGLAPQERPAGSFLLDGPTGVGKTELARQLASTLGMRLVRLDMSEYMEKHTVSRLVGAPPGYVGFEQNGLLVNAVRESPHSVVLLDEIEKAHPDIFNMLLQVMDYGTMTDGSGRQADFRHTILLMTTNVGAGEKARRVPGFGGRIEEPKGETYQRTFSPEFRNRLDGIIRFNPLTPDTMLMIAGKFLDHLAHQIGEKGLVLSATDKARAWLAENGYDPSFGARPMDRLVREMIAQPLAAMLLSGKEFPGGKVVVGLEDGKLTVGSRRRTTKHTEA
jgi:ATP-dependent Clp protease ATP-binding subunit ClpA